MKARKAHASCVSFANRDRMSLTLSPLSRSLKFRSQCREQSVTPSKGPKAANNNIGAGFSVFLVFPAQKSRVVALTLALSLSHIRDDDTGNDLVTAVNCYRSVALFVYLFCLRLLRFACEIRCLIDFQPFPSSCGGFPVAGRIFAQSRRGWVG